MASKVKCLGYEMQKVIDLGLIDQWLRGLCEIVPRSALTHPRPVDDEFNTHLIAYECTDAINTLHIQNLTGFHQLLSASAQQNVAVDIYLRKNGYLMVSFKPERQFKLSQVFNARYMNVVPRLFAKGRDASKKLH